MENPTFNDAPSPSEDREEIAKRERERQRKLRSPMARIVRSERQTRLRAERESRRILLLSMARRAVNRAMSYNPGTFVGRWRRERVLRKWQQDSAALASASRPWNNP
jgi:hypothetical protein